VQPQTTPEIVARPGLALLLDILIAPRRAYATIAVTREWWPAALVVGACIVAQNILTVPADLNVLSLEHVPPPLGGNTVANIAANTVIQLLWQAFTWNVVASLFANFCAAGRPVYGLMYRTFFALAANAAVPIGLGLLATGIVIHARDPSAYHSVYQFVNALPISLALFASPNNPREADFLSSFDLPTIWSVLLISFGGRAIGGIKLVPALIVPCAIVFISALIFNWPPAP